MEVPQYAVLTPTDVRESFNICLRQVADVPSVSERLDACLADIYFARCRIGIFTKMGVNTDDLCEAYMTGMDQMRESVRARVMALAAVLVPSWEWRIADYHVESAADAIRDGLPCELWYMLDRRDTIEAHLHLADLHPTLVLPDEMVKKIQMEDRALLQCGAELFEFEPQASREERAWLNPRTHWWWWLDQKRLPSAASGAETDGL